MTQPTREEVKYARVRLCMVASETVRDLFPSEARTIDEHIEALEAALRAAHSVLDDILGPCEPGCDCVLHEIRALLPEDRDE